MFLAQKCSEGCRSNGGNVSKGLMAAIENRLSTAAVLEDYRIGEYVQLYCMNCGADISLIFLHRKNTNKKGGE